MNFLSRLRRLFSPVLLTSCLLSSLSALAEPAGNPEVRFDARGNATVSGVPAFPLSIFVEIPPRWLDEEPQKLSQILDEIAASPFRVLINPSAASGSPDQFARYHEQLSRRGLTEFFGVEHCERDALERLVKLAGDSPTVAGWYIADQGRTDIERIRQNRAWLKELDPSRPTLAATSDRETSQLAAFAESADIIAGFTNPVPQGRLIEVTDFFVHLTETRGKTQPAWCMPQAFGEYVRNLATQSKGETPRPGDALGASRGPTRKELRAIAYLSLVHGATGLAVYHHTGIQSSLDATQRWKAICEFGRDIQKISPILVATQLDDELLDDDNFSIHLRLLEKDGKRYMLAVNSTREYQNTFIQKLPWAIKRVTVVQGRGFAAGSSDYGTNEILIGLDALDSIVIEIESP